MKKMFFGSVCVSFTLGTLFASVDNALDSKNIESINKSSYENLQSVNLDSKSIESNLDSNSKNSDKISILALQDSKNIESKYDMRIDSKLDSILLADNADSIESTQSNESDKIAIPPQERGISQKEIEDERESKPDGIFFNGGLEVFNKTAFSMQQSNKNPLPTVSYGYVLGELSVGYKYKAFEVAVGGVAAGLTVDSSKGLAYNYVGANPGWNLSQSASENNASRMFIHNAYFKYSLENFDIQIGRFAKSSDWVEAYVEGIDMSYSFAKHYHVSLFGMSTLALVGAGWLNTFATTYSSYGLMNAEFGYTSEILKADIFAYFGMKEYFAPGFNLELSFGKPESVAFTTKINVLFPYQFESMESLGKYFWGDFGAKNTGFTSSILVRQDVDFYDKYKVAVAVYKNINNANARMGMFGNPIGIDIWDSSVYTTGTSLNAAAAPDAFSFLFFTQAQYENLHKYVKRLVVGLDGRYTNAPSANEYSLKLHASWEIIDNLSISAILNYYTMDMINPMAWGGIANPRYTADRSYLMTTIAYMF
ncbi:outer membrane family protein [Helicobacter saguini]|nr:outer membrane family protein [Helicobacter saguini]